MEDDPKKYVGPKPGKFFTAGLIGAVVVIMALTAGLVLSHDLTIERQTSALAQAAAEGRNVLVSKVFEQPSSRTIDLPATIHGYTEASIYAKVAGYLDKIMVDKGDRIRRGQLLAVLQTPDLDQQVVNAKANYWLQSVTDQRNQALVPPGVIAQQVADTSHAAMLQAKATYDQLLAEQGYKRIIAPFDGIVTARYVDPGALIPDATTSTTGSGIPIFGVATLAPVRIYANVPQSLALFIRNGDSATIAIDERPGKVFHGPIIRHPEALDSASRTMLVEVDLPNTDFALYPGMYARAAFAVTASDTGEMVRDDALVFRDGKVFVPVVRSERLQLVEVRLGYDDGQNVVVSGDVHGDDLVALNIGQAAQDGQIVHPVFANQQ
jgi:membrane fusion protein, multidrug efflux system